MIDGFSGGRARPRMHEPWAQRVGEWRRRSRCRLVVTEREPARALQFAIIWGCGGLKLIYPLVHLA